MVRKEKIDDEEAVQMNTPWFNPTNREAKFKIQITHGGEVGRAKWKTFVIKPGETIEIDSEYDSAIRVEDTSRSDEPIVVGGKCPWLKKGRDGKGDKTTLEPCLDWMKAAEEAELDRLTAKAQLDAARQTARVRMEELRVALPVPAPAKK